MKDVHLKAPQAVRRGENVRFTCQFDLEGDPLYAVKWYQSSKEFYRYVPKEVPPTKVFHLPGVNVDVSRSNSQEVVLRDVQLELSGTYKCEISADAPSFHTDIAVAQMIVVDMPDDRPLIIVEKTEYEVGERLRANCTSPRSYPAANLTWYVNDKPVSTNHIREFPNMIDPDYMETSRLGLEFDTDGSSFQGGKLSVKCLARIYSLYRKITEVAINEEKPRLASVLGTRESPKGRGGAAGGQTASTQLLLTGLLLLILLGR